MRWQMAVKPSEAILRNFSSSNKEETNLRAGKVGVFKKTVAAGTPTLWHTEEQFHTQGPLAIDDRPPALQFCRLVPCVRSAFCLATARPPVPQGATTISRHPAPTTSTSDFSDLSGSFWRATAHRESTTDPPLTRPPAKMATQAEHGTRHRTPLWVPDASNTMRHGSAHFPLPQDSNLEVHCQQSANMQWPTPTTTPIYQEGYIGHPYASGISNPSAMIGAHPVQIFQPQGGAHNWVPSASSTMGHESVLFPLPQDSNSQGHYQRSANMQWQTVTIPPLYPGEYIGHPYAPETSYPSTLIGAHPARNQIFQLQVGTYNGIHVNREREDPYLPSDHNQDLNGTSVYLLEHMNTLIPCNDTQRHV